MFKYVAKGPDTAEYRIREETQHDRNDAESVAARNEHAQAKIAEDFIRARYLSATEAAWRIFGNELTHKTPSVQRLAIHDMQENRPQFRGRNATGSDASALIRYFLRPDRYSNMKYNQDNARTMATTRSRTRQSPLSPSKRGKIVALARFLPPSAVAREEDVHPSTVSRIVAKDALHNTRKDLPRSGRPRKLTERSERLLRRWVLGNRRMTVKQTLGELQQLGIKICASTLNNYLSKQGLRKRVMQLKPFITPAQQSKRLSYAVKHANRW
ncbi:unnamed protein product [Tilletia controversa]|uniref:Transposase Tc1-like domain-containing protein n=3 Tax=Tilletia TaxID=13289 RepID=A0A8T8S8J3_9BASI|nr:hypothetical protein A4X03_0g9906 [Tilletia caries]CAD6929358.1 unnamed protein product [Tilletia controversa]